MPKIKTFIINLKKDKNRYIHIVEQLKSFKSNNYERIDAIYGKDLKNDYGNKLSKSEIGVFMSHIKTLFQIIEQKLDYAIILEDDVTLTNWFNKIEEIIDEIYPNFDICWIGNSEGKWPRNPCNLIPDYDYNKLNFVTKYIVKLDTEKKNNPVGGYGIIITQKGARNILTELNLLKFQNFENIKNFEIQKPIDLYYINKKFDRYMTIPSIITHCYIFDSNIRYTSQEERNTKINPFEDVWGKYKKEEIECLEILQNLEKILTTNNINYSLFNSTLLGFMRTNKFLYYNDKIDIIVKKEDMNKFKNLENDIKKFAHILKLENPEINNSLFYKIFCRNNFTELKNKNYTWPFINVFVYEYLEDSKLYILSKKIAIENVLEKTKMVQIKSHNNNLTYNTRIFEDSEKILNKLYKDWKKICYSSTSNNKQEYENNIIYSFNCENIIPDYKENTEKYTTYKKFYKKVDKYFIKNFIKNIIKVSLIILILLIIIILFIYLYTNKQK